ncbi:MAG: class I SAM-dependent methyltransferase [Halioglobus sp.]|nr:class I SAM-dependent methyltransferase [Halioglobus sp.]
MHHESSEILSELETWYGGTGGRYLLDTTRTALQPVIETAFGYHILQLGVFGGEPLCHDSPIRHQVICGAALGEGVGLVAHSHELPLDSDSVDMVIAHHCLEFSDNPHQVLREIQRVLTPQGQLLVIGFNRYSLHGAASTVRGMLRNPLWQAYRPLSEHRLTDWLHLLGCEVQEVFRLYGVPPIGRGRLRTALERCDAFSARHNLPFSGLYVVHAIKQVAGLPRPRRLQKRRSELLLDLVPKPAAAPTPRGQSRDTSDIVEKGNSSA